MNSKEEKGTYKVPLYKHKELFPKSTSHLGRLHKIKYTYFKDSDFLLVEEDLKKSGKYLCVAVAFFPSIFYFGWKDTMRHTKAMLGNTSISTHFTNASKEDKLNAYLKELIDNANV